MFSRLFERNFMNRSVFLFVFFLTISARAGLYGIGPIDTESLLLNITGQDTLKERQILYNGILWRNKYHRIKEDQFLFSDFFLPCTISINGHTFKDVRIKYDIYSDEIIIPINREEIVQLNKEMVDSFTISFENKVYKFTNIQQDTLKGFNGYVNVLYKGKSALYVKYKKEISPSVTDKNDGEFYQTHKIYFVKDKSVYLITSKNVLFKVINNDKVQIRNFINKNKLRVSKKIPESFVPVIMYYDSISH
jgi:hypothetical protein